jgi:hypothetical protein
MSEEKGRRRDQESTQSSQDRDGNERVKNVLRCFKRLGWNPVPCLVGYGNRMNIHSLPSSTENIGCKELISKPGTIAHESSPMSIRKGAPAIIMIGRRSGIKWRIGAVSETVRSRPGADAVA